MDRAGTNCGYSGVTCCDANSCEGRLGDDGGHAEENLANSSRCPYVARPDLRELAEEWGNLPIQVRQAILMMAEAAKSKLIHRLGR